MTASLFRIALALAAPLLLMGCLLSPGTFTARLTINADRSFAFAYQGEVYASDGPETGKLGKEAKPDPAAKAETEAKRRAMAEALAKEAGYRSVSYAGDGKFLIDYAISGTLNHAFVYPFNSDAEVVFPFLVVELRGKDMVRVKAPGFAADGDKAGGMPGMDKAASRLNGSFTLDTDAQIVSQNNEDGASEAGGRRTIRWQATPLVKDAPAATLRVAPLP